MQWLEYQIFVKHPDDRERLILSLVKELKEQFLKDGLIDTYHFLRYGGSTEQSWIRFRLGKKVGTDEKTIDGILQEKSKEYDYIDRIRKVPFPALDSVSKVHDDIFTKFLFSISEISLAMLENRDNLPEWNRNLSEYSHLFLNQLGYNYLDEANFYSRWELERFSVLLQKYPEKFQKIIEIHKKKIDEMNAVLRSK